MDLLTLAAKIELDDSSYTKGVTNAEKLGKQLQGKMSAMTVAAGNLVADMVRKGISGINQVIGGAIDGYADYQQLIGGVETLFKGSADKVANYAKKSFKTTGLSANDYMETVTSFSASLIQGLGGNTAEAADLADMAITDMADNANKMGTDISSIQAAYQGFAKQNFTMLDNLKLGYGGTRGEMVRLINDAGILDHQIENLDDITFDQLVQAIHEIQTQMGITGTTAKEAADTISGSKASLKAAWKDLLTAVGGEGDQATLDASMENFKSAFTTYMENFVPTLVTTITNSGSLVTAVAEAIGDLPTTLLSEVGDDALESGAEMIRGVSKITSWLLDSLINVFKSASIDNSSATELGAAIGDFLGTAISKIVTNAGTIFTGVIELGKGLAEGLATGLFEGLFGEGAEVDKIAKELTGEITDAEYAATKSGALIQYMKTLSETYGDAAKGTVEWQEAVKELEDYIPGAGDVIKNFGSDVEGALDYLTALSDKMRETAVNAALMGALQESYGLLAKQNIEYRKQEAAYNRNTAQMDAIRGGIIDTIMKEATGKMAEMDENGGPVSIGQQDYYNKLMALSEGLSHVGDRMTDLEDLDFDELKDALDFLSSTAYSDEQYEAQRKAYEEAKANAEQAKSDMEASNKEIEATKAVIEDTKVAVEAAAKDLGTTFDTTSDDIASGGAETAAALHGAAAAIAAAAANIGSGGGGGTPEATGIDYVPFNGFRAELHRGETVLTRSKADEYRSGGAGTAEVVGALQTLNNNLQNTRIVVGEQTFGRAVARYGGSRVSDNIGKAESRYSSGYGT